MLIYDKDRLSIKFCDIYILSFVKNIKRDYLSCICKRNHTILKKKD